MAQSTSLITDFTANNVKILMEKEEIILELSPKYSSMS